MAEPDDVAVELEAVKAVYGDDCLIIDSYTPHLHLCLKPRTADVLSQQFVEAVIAIRVHSKYPEEPPHINIIAFKGLDEIRQKHLIDCVRDKARDLTPNQMLVELCEEAIEKLSAMNYVDGDCPLCLYPLVAANDQSGLFSFMKLMSCFHCFHNECIIRWWNWQQMEKDAKAATRSTHSSGENSERGGMCPVCRQVFQVKDFEHVLDLVGTSSPLLGGEAGEKDDDSENLLQSESEILRRRKFEAALKLQEERGGLIEPKKSIAVLPGMFLANSSGPSSGRLASEREQRSVEFGGSLTRDSGGSSARPMNLHRGKPRSKYPRRTEWVRKER